MKPTIEVLPTAKYTVHPVADMFPMMAEHSEEFCELAGSIVENGVLEPVVVDGNTLLDGRNRVAVCRKLGLPIPAVEWGEISSRFRSDITQAEWILETNLKRRHMTPDQRVMTVTEFNRWWIEQENAEKTGGRPSNEEEKPDQKSGPVSETAEKHARSTPGRIAELAQTSRYKAEQAVAVSKAAERGDIPKETVEQVKSGRLPLKDAARTIKKSDGTSIRKNVSARGGVLDRAMAVRRSSTLQWWKSVTGKMTPQERAQMLVWISEYESRSHR